jgi:two-component system nitrogen regulation response regulator GlnG
MDEEVFLIDSETSEVCSRHESSPTEQVKSPSLKERRDNIISLVKHYIKVAEEQLNTSPKELSKDAEEHLLICDWDGKEKELENAVKKACILSDGEILHIEDFDLKQRNIKSIDICSFIEEKLKVYMKKIKSFEKFNLYETVIPEVEKALILMVMKETKGNQTKTAKLLGINRNTLREKIKKLKINVKP